MPPLTAFTGQTECSSIGFKCDNALFVPETGNSAEYARFFWPVIGRGAIGFSPFGMDRTGYYNAQDDASHPRLNGWMKIGADGKYEFRTIRPGAYPHRSTPAHIHAHVYGPRFSERSIDDYWFKDDPRINEKELKQQADNGGHPFVVDVKRGSDGVWRGERDIILSAPK